MTSDSKIVIKRYTRSLCKELEPKIARLMEDVTEHFDLDAAGFAIINDDESIGYCALYNIADYLEKLAVSKGIDVVGMVFATQKPIAVDDYPAFPKAVSAWVQIGVKSVISAPVLVEGKLAGAISGFSISGKKNFSQSDIEAIEKYAEKVAFLLDGQDLS